MRITVKVTGGKNVYQGVKKVGTASEQIVNAEIETVMNGALKVLQKEGKPVPSKINWDTQKQKNAYFYYDAFTLYPNKRPPGYVNKHAGVHRYKRTGRYGKSFRVTKTGKGALRKWALENTWPKSMYVGGNAAGARQSRIHAGRWPLIKDTVSKFVKRLVTDVRSKSKPKIKQAIRAAGLRTR